MPLSLSEVIEVTNGKIISKLVEKPILGVSTDSRKIKNGDIFVALSGKNFDGHKFIDVAFKKAAIGAIVSSPPRSTEKFPNLIEVNDTLNAYGEIAKFRRKQFKNPIIAITGSCGKTSTKELVHEVLRQKFQTFASEKNQNNLIGVPSQILSLNERDQIAVLELGTNQPGEIRRLAEITQPQVAIITNIGRSHLQFLGSIEGVAKEKATLLEYATHSVLNADDQMTRTLLMPSNLENVTTFGWKNRADISATNIEIDQKGHPSFTLKFRNKKIDKIKLKLFGIHSVSNALAAASIAIHFGLDNEELKNGLEKCRTSEMRTQIIDINGISVINDTYNSNPDSLKAALDLFSRMKTEGKRIAVLGDMLELGNQSKELHFEIGREIGENVEFLFTIGDHSREIARGAKNSVRSMEHFSTAELAGKKLKKIASEGSSLLIKGSRSLKLERIIEQLK